MAKLSKARIDEQLALLRRGCVDVIREDELRERLATGRPLRVKAGFDPTAADLHLGHTVVIEKLRHFQQFGHEVIFIVGDYTARIGDPSGRSDTRPVLAEEEIEANGRTYAEQAFKILDRENASVVLNSSWMNQLSVAEMLGLASEYTVARMLERDDFAKRYASQRAIGIHEFLYPLIQGYDSVVTEADVEIGGTDQRFNLLVGRDMQRSRGMVPQVVITMPLLEGLDGKNKMSKSLGNHVAINDGPSDIYGKIMSLSDELMLRYYELLSEVGSEKLETIKSGKVHPMDAKKELAWELVERYHRADEADKAAADFVQRFQKGLLPEEIPEYRYSNGSDKVWICRLLKEAGLTASSSEARRLVTQGAVKLDGARVNDAGLELVASGQALLQVGKRRIIKVLFD
ncbi:MAG: tyrosine--tRNA ligase [Candidatus Binatia bacterium]